MTNFRERDLLKVTKDGGSRWNGGFRLTEGMTVRVVEVSPEGKLVKIQSSLLDDNHLSAWWDVNRFELHEAALPVQPKPVTNWKKAQEYLERAEERANDRTRETSAGNLALVGILSLLLDQPERVTDMTGHEIAPRDMARQIDELQTVRRALQTRVDELSEKTDILDAELAVAQGRERRIRTENQDLRVAVSGLKAEKREALEEVARLNRLLGIVPTRLEAVSDVEGFTVTENGNSVEIFDGEDTVTFERPIGDSDDSFIFVSPLPEDGVYITRAQWDALTRQGEIWAEDRDA